MIGSLPYDTKLVDHVKFNVSIYPVAVDLTTDGIQYESEVETAASNTYLDLFSIDTETYYPYLKGKLAWVYVLLSFEMKGGSGFPLTTFKVQFKKHDASTWETMSAEETYTTTTSYVAKKLEGYIDIDTVNEVPFDIRLQFKSEADSGTTERVTARLKNDTFIKIVGSRETR